MTDERIAVLAKHGIEGEDAITCLRQIDACDWTEISGLAQQFDIEHERVDFYRCFYGSDAVRAALTLDAEGWG